MSGLEIVTSEDGTVRMFVYGTLRPGQPNDWIMADVVRFDEGVTAEGNLYGYVYQNQSGEEEIGFPFANFETEGTITGTLLHVIDGRLLQRACYMEQGAGYQGVAIDVTLPNGETVEALAWHYPRAGKTAGGPRKLSTNDWNELYPPETRQGILEDVEPA